MQIAQEIFQTFIVQIGLFMIMAGLGLTLSLNDLVRAITFPKAVLLGLTGQLILLPLLAFALAFLFQPDPIIAIGIILLAACPGGITSNGYVLVSKGDVALSVTMTTISSLLTVVTMPILAYLAFATFADQATMIDVPAQDLVVSLAKLTLLPIIAGMLLRSRYPLFAERMRAPVRKMAFVILVMVIVGNTVFSLDVLKQHFLSVGFLALILNISVMAMGYSLARLFRLPVKQVISLTFEIGVQNVALVFTLAMAILRIPEYAAFTLVYAFIMKVTALGFASYALKYLAVEEESPAK